MEASISRKRYLKKYISGDLKKKKKRKVPRNANLIKRSKIIDDDIDLQSMRPLEDGEIELCEMDEDAPQIAGVIDDRPAELKAQEQYNAKRWKVFGGENGVSVLDNMDSKKQPLKPQFSETDKNSLKENKNKTALITVDLDSSPARPSKYDKQIKKHVRNETNREKSDSDTSPPRNNSASSNSDASPPRQDSGRKAFREQIKPFSKRSQTRLKGGSDSDCSSLKVGSVEKLYKHKKKSSPPRTKHKGQRSDHDSDNSPPRDRGQRKLVKDYRVKKASRKGSCSDSDETPPRREKSSVKSYKDPRSERKSRKHSSDSDEPPSRRQRKYKVQRSSRSVSPQSHSKPYHHKTDHSKNNSSVLFRDLKNKKYRSQSIDSDNSPSRKNKLSRHGRSSSDLSPPRNSSKDIQPKKKALYKPQDGFSSDEESRSRNKKMKITLDGKRAGLQDAKDLKQELSNLKKREDEVFSKLSASVSGVGAVAVKRDRKTGQIRDLEKEKEAQREKEAKATVVNEKYSKWGKGLKQVEDAATRAAEAVREMNKPLARYADDKDLDDFLKAQEREGDPMLDYIKQKQSEATALGGEKPIYKGSYNPNRFGIRPGHRWDGVVRSSGYEKEWFTHQNARKAVGEEAYKWSTSDM